MVWINADWEKENGEWRPDDPGVNVIPNEDAGTLGGANDRWDNAFLDALDVDGNATLTGLVDVGGVYKVDGNQVVGIQVVGLADVASGSTDSDGTARAKNQRNPGGPAKPRPHPNPLTLP